MDLTLKGICKVKKWWLFCFSCLGFMFYLSDVVVGTVNTFFKGIFLYFFVFDQF